MINDNFILVTLENQTHVVCFERWNNSIYKRVYSKLLNQQIELTRVLLGLPNWLENQDSPRFTIDDGLPRFEV